jgi:hypothetical protein
MHQAVGSQVWTGRKSWNQKKGPVDSTVQEPDWAEPDSVGEARHLLAVCR